MRDLFLRLLGLIALVAFLSLLVQLPVLYGRDGLLPAEPYLETVRAAGGALLAPTIFWIGAGDAALRAAALAGAGASVLLFLGVAPRAALLAIWALYLSFVTVGQDFLSFQWDNLLLETAVMALFVAPRGLRPRLASAPHPLAVWLVRWLVFRLQFESGAAKLLTGDPTWRDLTALATYYETAPLPTWIGWWAHQMPLAAHQACSLFTLVVELGLAPLVFAGHRLRGFAAFVIAGMQISILLTGNYGFFNYLSLALLLLVLDDDHLRWLAARVGLDLAPAPPADTRPSRTRALAAAIVLLVPLSVIPFLRFVGVRPERLPLLAPVQSVVATLRSLNAYHLFAQMTLVRNEVVIEGSADGAAWLPYEFRYKPGDPLRAPAVVAPHQPRVDFQLWFLPLRGRLQAPYFDALLERLLTTPAVVAPLFAADPFPTTPPAFVRVVLYRYRFTDRATRAATGAWWTRQQLGVSRPLSAAAVSAP